jgi:hypothetical protein
MSIKNKVTGNFPELAVYDSAGNILGLSIPSTINATAPNVGGLIVSSNTSNLELSTGIGNGNITTGKNLTVGNAQSFNVNTSAGNVINVYSSGTYTDVELTLSAKGAANVQLKSNAYFTANVVQGNNTSVGTVLHSLYSDVNASAANVGAFRVGNAGNAQITTAIGNGNIYTGNAIWARGNVSVGNATSTGAGALRVRADANTYAIQLYGNDGNIAWQIGTSNGNANGSSTLSLNLSNVANNVVTWKQATSTTQVYQYRSVPVLALRQSTGTTISNATDTRVAFDSVDTSTGVPSTALTASDIGITVTNSGATFTYTGAGSRAFLVSYYVNFSANATGARISWITLNGNLNSRLAYNNLNNAGTQPTFMSGSAVVTLATNDYFEIYTYQLSGTSLTLNADTGGTSGGTGGKIQVTML